MFGLLNNRVGCAPILMIIFGNDRASQRREENQSITDMVIAAFTETSSKSRLAPRENLSYSITVHLKVGSR
jgi:hypothetical protein